MYASRGHTRLSSSYISPETALELKNVAENGHRLGTFSAPMSVSKGLRQGPG